MVTCTQSLKVYNLPEAYNMAFILLNSIKFCLPYSTFCKTTDAKTFSQFGVYILFRMNELTNNLLQNSPILIIIYLLDRVTRV